MALMIIVGSGTNLYHSICHRAGLRCHVHCRLPRRNCTRIDDWISLHGLEELPAAAGDAPDVYFFYLRASVRA